MNFANEKKIIFIERMKARNHIGLKYTLGQQLFFKS